MEIPLVDKALFSNDRNDWGTPPALFEKLNEVIDYPFCVDVCANESNHILPNYIGSGGKWHDALAPMHWRMACPLEHQHSLFMNPPYKNAKQFVEKMVSDSQLHPDDVYLALLASRTDTKMFHETIIPNAKQVAFVKGRIKFNGAESGAPFPSMIVVFTGKGGYQPVEFMCYEGPR